MPGKDLCLIMARGGSKRVPHKNSRPFCGMPMIAWPTRAAVASGLFSHVVISTEDDEIAKAALEQGAIRPFIRPRELADDFSTTGDNLRYAFAELAKHWDLPRRCCLLYGTSAMVNPALLREAAAKLDKTDCVMAVCAYPHPLERALVDAGDGQLRYKTPESFAKRTQDCEKCYYDIGLLYYLDIRAFLAGETTMRRHGIIVPREFATDIDTEDDWKFAEMLAQWNGLGRG